MWLAHHQRCLASWSLLLAVGEERGKRDEMGEDTEMKRGGENDEIGEERILSNFFSFLNKNYFLVLYI
jgi:hypothetical protein